MQIATAETSTVHCGGLTYRVSGLWDSSILVCFPVWYFTFIPLSLFVAFSNIDLSSSINLLPQHVLSKFWNLYSTET